MDMPQETHSALKLWKRPVFSLKRSAGVDLNDAPIAAHTCTSSFHPRSAFEFSISGPSQQENCPVLLLPPPASTPATSQLSKKGAKPADTPPPPPLGKNHGWCRTRHAQVPRGNAAASTGRGTKPSWFVQLQALGLPVGRCPEEFGREGLEMSRGSALRQACASPEGTHGMFKPNAGKGREEQGAGMESNGAGDEGRPFFCPISGEGRSFVILQPPWSQHILSRGQYHPV